MSKTILDVKGLRTYFFTKTGVNQAVDGISYTVHEGEVAALVGESGSGKSVSAYSLLGLVPFPGKVMGGEAFFDGEDLLQMPEHKLTSIRGRQIAIISQEPMTALNPVLSIGDQISELLIVHLKLTESQARQRVVELLDMVGIPNATERYGNYPHQFSGGMRQRVIIAMAMACGPRVIFADEPTTALDMTVQSQVLDLLTSLTRQTGLALILITHNLGVVARYADTVNVMQAGKIVESGPADEVFAHPKHAYTQRLLECVPKLAISDKGSN